MKKFFETLRNIWKIDDLRKRILLTLGLIAVYRLGSFVVLPGVDPAKMAALTEGGGQGLLGLVNTFTGGAFFNVAVFALGIMPYISASIIVQLLGFAVPYFQKLQKEGESGTRKLNQITRVLTIAITAVQGSAYLTYIASDFGAAISPGIPPTLFWASNVVILTAGTVFCMWLGERITERGIGNGISLLIMIGIIADLPLAIAGEVDTKLASSGSGGLIMLVIELAIFMGVILATIAVVQAVRKIPIQFAKRMSAMSQQSTGRKTGRMREMAGSRDYIPVKLNASGVMPIIFAQALMFLPGAAAQYLMDDAQSGGFLASLSDLKSIPYNVIFFIIVVVFTYVYTALVVNPKQYADHLSRQNAFIPGVQRGKPTEEFIDTVTTRVTLPGSLALATIAILPAIAMAIGVDDRFALFYGGTSLLIMVGVVLDTLQQIESHLLMRQYDGLVKSGNIKGRSGQQPIGASL